MKLTEERRTKLIEGMQWLKGSFYETDGDTISLYVNHRETAQIYDSDIAKFLEDLLTIHLPDLIASEQAWKEEATKWEKRFDKAQVKYVEVSEQLNQAVKLLEEVYEREGWLRIKEFLSSLGKENDNAT